MKEHATKLLLATLLFNIACGLDEDCTAQGKRAINDGYPECSARNSAFAEEQEERARRAQPESREQKMVNEIW